MKQQKTVFKFFTIADYDEEAAWLRSMALQGWQLEGIQDPCLYRFTAAEARDIIYRLDVNTGGRGDDSGYFRLFEDCGWTYLFCRYGFHYFCRPADSTSLENGDIFSDDGSRLDLLRRVLLQRVPVLTVLYLVTAVMLFLMRHLTGNASFITGVFSGMASGLLVVYTLLFIRIAVKYRSLRRDYNQNN